MGHGKVKHHRNGGRLIFKGWEFTSRLPQRSYKEADKKDAPAVPAAAGEKPAGSKESKTTATPAKAPEAKPKKQAAE